MSQILPGLFLGDMENAKNKETLDYIKVKYKCSVYLAKTIAKELTNDGK